MSDTEEGNVAIVCVIVACFFGAISGSTATVAALGAVLIPAMIEQGDYRTVLRGAYGGGQLHRHCHSAEYRVRGLRIHHRCFHSGYVHRRNRSGILMGVALVIVVMIEAHQE